MAKTYDLGDLVRITGTFRNAAGALLNPTAVVVQIMAPDGTIDTRSGGSVGTTGTGVFYVDVDANAPGRWKYRFYSTGTGQAAEEGVFSVAASPFVP